MQFPEEERRMLEEYGHLQAAEFMGKKHGTQNGDPKKGAKAMYEFAIMQDPPLRVVIGRDAYGDVMGKVKEYE